jgi:hypothetical protein
MMATPSPEALAFVHALIDEALDGSIDPERLN